MGHGKNLISVRKLYRAAKKSVLLRRIASPDLREQIVHVGLQRLLRHHRAGEGLSDQGDSGVCVIDGWNIFDRIERDYGRDWNLVG